jgi:hypothetical protein
LHKAATNPVKKVLYRVGEREWMLFRATADASFPVRDSVAFDGMIPIPAHLKISSGLYTKQKILATRGGRCCRLKPASDCHECKRRQRQLAL